MKFSSFLKDRIAYTAVYIISTCAIILIMYLTLIINRLEFPINNIFYAFLVSIVFYIIFIMYDYYRNKSFYNQLNSILNSEKDLDYILNIGSPNNFEQAMFKKVLLKLYKLSGDKTIKYEEAHKQYMYFVNQWVHQMKTPVSVINLLLQEQVSEGQKEVFESISEENEKLAHGLDMMLYNARLNGFNLDFNVESFDIISIAREVINDNKKSMIRHHIFPKINTNKEISVQTDRKWIYFVINQIVINAIKYSKSDSEESKLITFEVSEEASKTTLSISDQGIGIPKEDLSRVFNAFFTGKNGRKTSESTGMGMYLAKKVCDNLGHGLLVKSTEGFGTTFSIVFHKGKNIFNL
ncbi:sensor histidine kinase [Clostridium sp. YIM B02505]|uniref:histidine kinase n=1 Tax=Clostridium yunnanense TaxID=2800325 RepID=A0ABS1EPH7_9CLOT|nr:sensor histidine kinase [Clostridium yunnanense]MBK1811257.1 sensor histidine kinase [Clostridium yunnanense]